MKDHCSSAAALIIARDWSVLVKTVGGDIFQKWTSNIFWWLLLLYLHHPFLLWGMVLPHLHSSQITMHLSYSHKGAGLNGCRTLFLRGGSMWGEEEANLAELQQLRRCFGVQPVWGSIWTLGGGDILFLFFHSQEMKNYSLLRNLIPRFFWWDWVHSGRSCQQSARPDAPGCLFPSLSDHQLWWL